MDTLTKFPRTETCGERQTVETMAPGEGIAAFHAGAIPGKTALTDEERQARREADDFARASVELEGFKLPKVDEELSRRYVAGEITIEDAIKAVHEFVHGR